MILRKFILDDLEEVVDMYMKKASENFSDRKIGNKYFFYKKIINTVESDKVIMIVVDNDVIAGFTISSIDYNEGLTEPIMYGEAIYVKEEYRKSKAAHMLINSGREAALKVGVKGYLAVTPETSEMYRERFGLTIKSIVLEG